MTRAAPRPALAPGLALCLALGLAAAAAAGASSPPSPPSSNEDLLAVTVEPPVRPLAQAPAWFPLTFRFRNASDAPADVVAAEARLICRGGGWSREVALPPFATLAVPAGGEAVRTEIVEIADDALAAAAGDAACAGDTLGLEVAFTALLADGAARRPTATVRFALPAGWREASRVERWRAGRVEAVARAAWLARDDNRAFARRLAAFADSALAVVDSCLGTPGDAAAGVTLRLGDAQGPVGAAAEAATITLPARALDGAARATAETALTRDLVWLRLSARADGLPLWLRDAPRHRFGNAALARLGRVAAATASDAELARQAAAYRELKLDFVSEPQWPEYGREPAFLLAIGHVAWDVLRPLEAEHGPGLLAAALRCLDGRRAALRAGATEGERTAIVVDCFGRAAGRDLRAWFAERGIR